MSRESVGSEPTCCVVLTLTLQHISYPSEPPALYSLGSPNALPQILNPFPPPSSKENHHLWGFDLFFGFFCITKHLECRTSLSSFEDAFLKICRPCNLFIFIPKYYVIFVIVKGILFQILFSILCYWCLWFFFIWGYLTELLIVLIFLSASCLYFLAR